MTQKLPEFGPIFDDVGTVARAVGVREEDIRGTGLPIERVSCGVPFVMVPVTTRARRWIAPCPIRGCSTSRPICLRPIAAAHPIRRTTYSRMFAPELGVPEDPATGSASGPLGAYLVKHSLVSPARAEKMLNLQGVKLGRPSWIHISIETANGHTSRVRVGGTAVFVAEGTMEVED